VARFDRAIPPGGEGTITLTADLEGYRGSVTKSAKVMSNDARNTEPALTMRGTVKNFIDVRPLTGVLFRGTANQQTEQAVDITGASLPFHITKIESNLEEKIAYRLETVEEGKHYRLRISNRMTQGNYSGFVRLHTDLAQKRDVTVRVAGFIQG
jgi:hypothetical protein